MLLVLALAGAGLLTVRLVAAFGQPPQSWPINFQLYATIVGILALLALVGVLAYRVAAAASLSYEIDRNGLYIRWLGNRAIVPLAQIESVERGVVGLPGLAALLYSLGYYHSELALANDRPLHLIATRRPADCLVIHTATASYAISPEEPDAFVQELEQRRKLGAVTPLNATVERGRLLSYAFWADPLIARALLLIVLLNLFALGLIMLRYPGLSEAIELRFDAVGDVAELRPRYQVLFLPLAACLVSLVNLGLGLMLYARNPLGARLLQLFSLLVQLLFLVPALEVLF